MIAKVGVGFCIDVTDFIELLVVGLGTNQTVFLPIAEVFLSLFWCNSQLDAEGYRVEPCFEGVC